MTAERKTARYGWTPDLPDHRDHLYSAPRVGPLPSKVDLRGQCPPIVDQGQLGSCTGNAIAGAVEFGLTKEGQPSEPLSRLFIYYGERVIEHTTRSDSGAMIRDGIKVVAKEGAPPEVDWPYDISKFARKPPARAYRDAKRDVVTSYQRLDNTNLDQLKACLADGYPFVFGFTVYESFESEAVAKSGVVPMPHRGERQLGGHAVVCVGYDDSSHWFIVRNSWGDQWGQQGYFVIPYAYLTNPGLASDFWTIRTVGAPAPTPRPAPSQPSTSTGGSPMFTRQFLADAAERVAATFVVAFAGILVASGADLLSVGALKSAAVAGIVAALTVVKTLAAGLVGQQGTASLLPARFAPTRILRTTVRPAGVPSAGNAPIHAKRR